MREIPEQAEADDRQEDDVQGEEANPMNDNDQPDNDAPQTSLAQRDDRRDEPESVGVVAKLVGSGHREVDAETGMSHYREQPGIFRPFARRAYQRELAMNAIRNGFEDLSDLMADIRDGLDASVDRQGDLLEQLKWLPTVARQNAESAERFEEQFKRNNDQLAKSNEIAGENLKLQADSLKTQAESVRALRDSILNQRDQNSKLNDVLGKMGKESRDQKREVDEMQARMDRMRESDTSIADNLGSVAAAIRGVSQQTSAQGDVVARLQAALDERTERLAADAQKRSRSQTWLVLLTLLVALLALAAVAGMGYLYLLETGAFDRTSAASPAAEAPIASTPDVPAEEW